MLIFWAIFLAVFGVLLIDFSLIGYLPKVLGIWPAIDGSGGKKPLIESYPHWVETNAKGKFIELMVNRKMGYKSVALMEGKLILRNTRLTYLMKIEIPSIEYFEVRRNVWGRYIKLLFTEKGEEFFFSFKPRKVTDWVSCLSGLGLNEKG